MRRRSYSPGFAEGSLLTRGLFDAGLREVIALEQERHVSNAGERIGENITQIEACGVVTLSVSPVGLRRDGYLRRVDRLDRDIGFVQERQRGIEQNVVSTRDGSEFHGRAGGDQDSARIPNHVPKILSLFLGQKENQYRRRVDSDHLGRPRSS